MPFKSSKQRKAVMAKISFGRHKQGVFYPADAELKKQEPGVRYFVTYANDTKIRTFSNKNEAVKFVRRVSK